MSELGWMLAPVAICLVSVAALGWFGLHVLQRGVIFVDLALAQIAALGATYAVFLGHDADEPFTRLLSLSFTLLGALAFASFRQFEDRVPQEAIIGISYAVSAALGVLLIELASDPHGAEKVQHLMVGNIVWVRWDEVLTAAVIVGVVGLVHAIVGRRLMQISLDPDGAAARGVRVGLWDLLFYATFGAVLTAIVSIVGVLLVFSFLVIPAVVGKLFASSIGGRLAIGYGLATLASVAGVAISYEHSTGPIIVALLGAALVVALAVVSVQRAPAPGLQFVKLMGGGALVATMLFAFARFSADSAGHEHEAGAHDHGHDHADEALLPEATQTPADELDPLSRFEAAVAQARAGDAEGLRILAELTRAEAPFIQQEAEAELGRIAGEATPEDGDWASFAADPPAGWQDRAADPERP